MSKYICSIDQSLTNSAFSVFKIDDNYYNDFLAISKLLFEIKSKIKPTLRSKINESSNSDSFFVKLYNAINQSKLSMKQQNIALDNIKILNDIYKTFREKYDNVDVSLLVEHVKSFSYKSKFKDDIERLLDIKDAYENMIKEFDISMTVLEGYSYNSLNSSSRFQLGELGGMIRTSSFYNDVRNIGVIAPLSLKSVFCKDLFNGGKNVKKDNVDFIYSYCLENNIFELEKGLTDTDVIFKAIQDASKGKKKDLNKVIMDISLNFLKEQDYFVTLSNELANDDEIDSYALGYIMFNHKFNQIFNLYTFDLTLKYD